MLTERGQDGKKSERGEKLGKITHVNLSLGEESRPSPQVVCIWLEKVNAVGDHQLEVDEKKGINFRDKSHVSSHQNQGLCVLPHFLRTVGEGRGGRAPQHSP